MTTKTAPMPKTADVPSAENITVIPSPVAVITNAQAYRSFANYINNTLGLGKETIKDQIDNTITTAVKKAIQEQISGKLEVMINAAVNRAFTEHFKTSGAVSAKESMRRFIADQIAASVKENITKRLYITTTVEEIK